MSGFVLQTVSSLAGRSSPKIFVLLAAHRRCLSLPPAKQQRCKPTTFYRRKKSCYPSFEMGIGSGASPPLVGRNDFCVMASGRAGPMRLRVPSEALPCHTTPNKTFTVEQLAVLSGIFRIHPLLRQRHCSDWPEYHWAEICKRMQLEEVRSLDKVCGFGRQA